MNNITPSSAAGLTHKQKILKDLLDARLANKPIIYIDGGVGNQVIRSGGYIPMHKFNYICSARDVRLRELRRDHLVPISDPPHVFKDAFYYDRAGNLKQYKTPQYRIELTPEEILALDWSEFWTRPFSAIFSRNRMSIIRQPAVNITVNNSDQLKMSFA